MVALEYLSGMKTKLIIFVGVLLINVVVYSCAFHPPVRATGGVRVEIGNGHHDDDDDGHHHHKKKKPKKPKYYHDDDDHHHSDDDDD